MSLPKLPTKHKKDEAELGLKFRKWVFANESLFAGSYELKDSRGKDYISFSEITEDQVDSALRTMSSKGNLIRIVSGSVGSPDYVLLKNMPAYVVIKYPKGCYLIGIETLLLEKERSKRKSLTEERAKEISIKSVIMK